MILLSASLATLVGAILIPTGQRIFSIAISGFSIDRSVPRLLFHAFSKSGIRQFRNSISLPSVQNLHISRWPKGLIAVLIIHVLGTAVWTVGVLSALYAGYLAPEIRVTSSTLSGVINGIATLMMFIVVDPFLSLMTDDAIDSRLSEASFRRSIVLFAGSRFLGTLLAQALLVPGAILIAKIAKFL